jgi:hypothetical protein
MEGNQMTVAKEDLKAQLLDYRKASRALMWYYDSSQKLYELITEALELMDLSTKDVDLEDEITDWDRPKGVSFDAFSAIKINANDWCIERYSEGNPKMTKNSFYMKIYLDLDVWPKNDPDESISGLSAYAWRVKDVTGKAIHNYDEIDDDYDSKLIKEDSGIDSDLDFIQPMKLTVFPDIWSANNGKYNGDYATGLYDLADLVDEDAVLNTVIADIKSLVKEWSS